MQSFRRTSPADLGSKRCIEMARHPAVPVPRSESVAIYNLSLKDEDRACTAVADVCGEAIELLLVADGHGGPEVTQHASDIKKAPGSAPASKCR